MDEKKAKLIFNAGLTRSLLKKGARIIDIKPDRDNPVKSIFVFERDEIFENAFRELNEGLKEKNAE